VAHFLLVDSLLTHIYKRLRDDVNKWMWKAIGRDRELETCEDDQVGYYEEGESSQDEDDEHEHEADEPCGEDDQYCSYDAAWGSEGYFNEEKTDEEDTESSVSSQDDAEDRTVRAEYTSKIEMCLEQIALLPKELRDRCELAVVRAIAGNTARDTASQMVMIEPIEQYTRVNYGFHCRLTRHLALRVEKQEAEIEALRC
jgi:hypothetical protein